MVENIGIDIGCRSIDIFRHFGAIRANYVGLTPYDAQGTDWNTFSDQ